MATLLENFVITHPEVTLSHTDYGRHFNLGNGINILSAPTQRLQSFVEEGGTPYRFIVVGQLASFKVIEDSVCGFQSEHSDSRRFLHVSFWSLVILFRSILASLNPPLSLQRFFGVRCALYTTSKKRTERRMICTTRFCFSFIFLTLSFQSSKYYLLGFFFFSMAIQRAQWRTSNGHLAFRAYNASNHPLSSTDLGALMLAVVELRCLDVGHSLTPSAFSRVRYSRVFPWFSDQVLTAYKHNIDLLD